MAQKVLDTIKQNSVRWVNLRFTDPKGKQQHVSYPSADVDDSFFEDGKMFDGSSITGWKGINESDMVLIPDPETAVMDPFAEQATLIINCDIVDPITGQNYERDPRSLAKRAENYLRSSGIGDTVFFGPEPEFFVFDSVSWDVQMGHTFYRIRSEEAQWESAEDYEEGNLGHRPSVKGGYFPVPPVDSAFDMRNAMCAAMENMGLKIEVHHHEVATACQNEIGVKFNSLVKKADELQILKYCVHNIAAEFGKSATFMPKPLVGDNGNGMHCHQSITKDGQNIFSGEGYAGLSDEALYYIGGIIHHARALNAFTNASTNSYKRLVPGFEAPVILAYSSRNRSASIRIPYVANPIARRIEVRFPDPTANPYLAFSALMMAGLDGIQNKMHPGDPADKDLYDLPPEEAQNLLTVASSLDVALEALNKDREFLKRGDVFSDDLIDGYLEMKQADVDTIRMATHPAEFAMYYSL